MAVEENVNDGMITSSPGPTSASSAAISSAPVQECVMRTAGVAGQLADERLAVLAGRPVAARPAALQRRRDARVLTARAQRAVEGQAAHAPASWRMAAAAPAGPAARPHRAGMLAAVTARGWASVVRTALVTGLLLASATGSVAHGARPARHPRRRPRRPADGSAGGDPAGPSVRSVPSTADPGFDDTWCGTPRSSDDSASQVTTAPRFKVVYAYPTDAPNRFAQIAGPIQSSVRTFAQQVMGNSGDRKTIRFDLGTSCGPRALDIATVALPGATSAYAGLDPTQFEAIRGP